MRIANEYEDRLQGAKVAAPSVQYAQRARCRDFVPRPQYDEVPKISCPKLGAKLETFKKMIKTSSKKTLAVTDSAETPGMV